ncbi:hypothetical protein ACFC0P_37245, partial [Streptomyces broussonetiae]
MVCASALTGEGLEQAVKGADVVVDVSNSPSFETEAALDFFTRSVRNSRAARVGQGRSLVHGADAFPGSRVPSNSNTGLGTSFPA